MDMFQDISNIQKPLRTFTNEGLIQTHNIDRLPMEMPCSIMIDEIIDVNNINYTDDENWLYELPVKNSNIQDLRRWLYQDFEVLKDFDYHNNRLLLLKELVHINTKKNIDTRTFTRPKKRFNRPSIENFGDNLKNDQKEMNLDNSILNNMKINIGSDIDVCDSIQIAQKAPLHFDISQPTTTSIFEKIVANSSGDDSFQNMSPPSLINSMCSSTFTNLMENSMIKNDPLLREISVTDYTEAMLQDYDPPLFKSITDSCSSINLDNPESFIKQNVDSALNNVYKKNVSGCSDSFSNVSHSKSDNTTFQDTYVKESSNDISSAVVRFNNDTITLTSDEESKLTAINTFENLNGTYRKILSYTYNELNQTINLRQSSLRHSSGSTDSLDYLSSLSSSSRDSNKILNMAEVDAIVLQQEQCLRQAVSTPKVTNKRDTTLWADGISPIVPCNKGDISDTDSKSSNDEYRTVRSTVSSNGDGPSDLFSNENINVIHQNNLNPKNLNKVGSKLTNNTRIFGVGGSYSNLKTAGSSFKGSYTNLKATGASFKSTSSILNSDLKGTNLRNMSTNLKGSYTQLKPVLLNLPATQSSSKMYDSSTIRRPNSASYRSQPSLNVAEPTLRDYSLKDHTNTGIGTKPHLKASGLPRPVSSIPRPSVTSKIPALRSKATNMRQLSRPSSKNNLDYDF
ncbi:hypothetical protein FQR65_LT04419 [Abscondita terminalis]|nr:hypothetical protein FQR65_LT04419 [Abscondita terminalis]